MLDVANGSKVAEVLPQKTMEAIKQYRIAIKGPLGTPIGKGFRSANILLRQLFDLYACVRPVSHIPGVPTPVKNPDAVNMVIFRENTEDVHVGIEWEKGSEKLRRLMAFVKELTGRDIRPDSAVSLKCISEFGTKRLVRKAIQYAIDNRLPSVTLVHKGNVMKTTEGGFRRWGYELAAEEFSEQTITEAEALEKGNPDNRIIIKDRITDAMFQQILLSPRDYSVLALPNLSGDFISDALAAQVGGLGVAPGGNIGDGYAIFESTHGIVMKHAGKDKVNPSSFLLSGALMFDHIGWHEAAEAIRKGIRGAIAAKTVTYDLHRNMPEATEVSCSGFGQAVCQHMAD